MKPMNPATTAEPGAADLEAARRGEEAAFERVVAPYRGELQAHCYRMLGSAADAEDALQETLLRAWRGLAGFEGRSSLRAWLYRIATNVSLRAIERRPKRMLPVDYGPPGDPHAEPDAPLSESVWIEPYPDEALVDESLLPDARYEQRESVELAFVAALQHLPVRQRAVLLLRDVLGFAPAEIAETLDSTPASVYSALQRAHAAIDERLPERSQQTVLRAIDDARLREVTERFMEAWEANDVAGLVAMLTEDAAVTMPPRPSWYRGREAVAAFLAKTPMAARERWRVLPVPANGQLAFATYGLEDDGGWYAHAIQTITLDPEGLITEITAFLDPGAFRHFGLPHQLTA
jgi:RNA polymerase sigma-70 factor, ECF subfamily